MATSEKPSLKDLAIKELSRSKGQTKDQLMKNLNLMGSKENPLSQEQIEINRRKLTDALVILGMPCNNFINREFLDGEWRFIYNGV